jgi:predicted nucleic acid-binding protein
MIFVDAGLFYARLAEDDENHTVADLFFNGIALSFPLITTNAVIYEAHALLLRLSRSGLRRHGTAPDPMIVGVYELDLDRRRGVFRSAFQAVRQVHRLPLIGAATGTKPPTP